jgi:hypothetical protein
MAVNPETAVTVAQPGAVVIEQSTTDAMVEWTLDDFPVDRFNRLVPTQTLMLPTDLLRPVVQIVQLSPDPKNGGDVYTSKDTPPGHAAPTKVGLRKLATAAGISVIDERRVDDGRDPDVIEMLCVGEMLLPTGQRIRATGSKRIDLNAQAWSSPEHRGKYRSFFQEHVASRAQNRMIRALLSLRGSYPLEVYQKPFAVVSFAPNMAHPEVRSRILDAMTGATAQLYGPSSDQRQLSAGAPIDVSPAPEDDPAPSTPTVLPGEKLAAARATPAEPDWMTAGQPAAAKAAPSLVETLVATAEASSLKGGITDPQKARLTELLGGLNGTGEVGIVMRAAWGDGAVQDIDAAQASAITTIADSYASAEAFLQAWRAAAAGLREAAGA